MKVFNRTRSASLITHGEVARSFWARGRGLLGHAPLAVGEGMLITSCQSIHTFFMAFPIDVAFVNSAWQVVHVIYAMPAWRASGHYFKARAVLELPAGTLMRTGTQAGDMLDVEL